MGVKYYLKRVIAALLNQKQALPDANTDMQAMCDEILRQSSEKQEEALIWLKTLFAAHETALRQSITEACNKRAAEQIEAVYRKAMTDPLQSILHTGSGEPIPVVLICDDHYAIPTCVAITSLLCNKNEDTRYAVTVLGRALSEENERRLRSLGEFVTVLACEGAKNACYANSHHYVSEAALLKFDIPQLLGQYDKVLYLDSDVLVLEDLSELYATQLDNRYAAVARDLLGMYYQFHTRTGVSAYFNSGVLLLNTRQMRKDRMTAKLFRNKANDPWKLLMDQDTLNVTFAENVVWLHPRYNLMYANNFESGWSMEQMAAFYEISGQDMIETMKAPVIQHLSSAKKPWNTPLAEKYLDYQEYRVLFEILLEKQGYHASPKE